MKKLLKWVLPAILGIVPALGTDDPYGEIKDPFFTNSDTKTSIRTVYERGPLVMAWVDGVDTHKSDSIRVIAEYTPDGWEFDDATKTYKEKVIAKVICGDHTLEQPYTRREEFGYTLLPVLKAVNFIGAAQVANDDLDPETKVAVHDVARFERPDKTELTEKGVALHEVIAQICYNSLPMTAEDFLKEPVGTEATVATFLWEKGMAGALIEQLYPVIRTADTGVAFDYEWCYKHGGKKNKWHAYKTYSATPTTPVIRKNTLDDERDILKGTMETLLTQVSQEETGPGKSNHKACTPRNHTNGLPNGYRVVK